jgi:hypothetical protein
MKFIQAFEGTRHCTGPHRIAVGMFTAVTVILPSPAALAWGHTVHVLIGGLAASRLPDKLPDFFAAIRLSSKSGSWVPNRMRAKRPV